MKYLSIVLLAISGCSYTPESLGLLNLDLTPPPTIIEEAKESLDQGINAGITQAGDLTGFIRHEAPVTVNVVKNARQDYTDYIKDIFFVNKDNPDRVIVKYILSQVRNGVEYTDNGTEWFYNNTEIYRDVYVRVFKKVENNLSYSEANGWELYQPILGDPESILKGIIHVSGTETTLERNPSQMNPYLHALSYSGDELKVKEMRSVSISTKWSDVTLNRWNNHHPLSYTKAK